jgi:fermentation-respiration switch protein FrsA (DUF1100 family)
VAKPSDVSFPSHGETCAAWHLTGEGEAFSSERGRPCVVMAHGLAGTKDSGLLPFAEGLAQAGLDALVFDYRCFGESSGEPRQLAWSERHRQDYRAAVEFARGLSGIDPDRVVLWGTSWSGGHAVRVAAGDPRIAAVICKTPVLDGVRVVTDGVRRSSLSQLARVTWAGLKDLAAAARGRAPELMPVVGPPGSVAVLNTPHAEPGYREIAGPTWRNEVPVRVLVAEAANRPIARIGSVRCPILIQIADRDSLASPAAARAAAWRAKGRVEVREYPCEHFEIYLGELRERAIADQIHFLRRHLGSKETAAGATVAAAATAD